MSVMAGGSDSGSNFRSSYYDKAGIRCNVNETKALDALLSRNPIEIGKLCNLLQRISVPATHRERLWKCILGVTPADVTISATIEEDRRGQFEDLKYTLEVMRLIDNTSSHTDIVTLMILLERGELQYDPIAQLCSPATRDIQLMFGVMCRVAPKLQDAYWLARNFYNHMLALRMDVKELINQTRTLLEKDDPVLLECILNAGRDRQRDVVKASATAAATETSETASLPIERWFNLLFASVLPDAALLKVWDKFLGGSVNKHLATTAKLILVALRPLIVRATSTTICPKQQQPKLQHIRHVTRHHSQQQQQQHHENQNPSHLGQSQASHNHHQGQSHSHQHSQPLQQQRPHHAVTQRLALQEHQGQQEQQTDQQHQPNHQHAGQIKQSHHNSQNNNNTQNDEQQNQPQQRASTCATSYLGGLAILSQEAKSLPEEVATAEQRRHHHHHHQQQQQQQPQHQQQQQQQQHDNQLHVILNQVLSDDVAASLIANL